MNAFKRGAITCFDVKLRQESHSSQGKLLQYNSHLPWPFPVPDLLPAILERDPVRATRQSKNKTMSVTLMILDQMIANLLPDNRRFLVLKPFYRALLPRVFL